MMLRKFAAICLFVSAAMLPLVGCQPEGKKTETPAADHDHDHKDGDHDHGDDAAAPAVDGTNATS